MTETITTEMDELEKIKSKYLYLAKLEEFKIQRIKLRINLEKIDKEEEKILQHLKKVSQE